MEVLTVPLPARDCDRLMEYETCHLYITSIEESQPNWAGFNLTNGSGRRKAAEWLFDQINEVRAIDANLALFDEWRLESLNAAELRERERNQRPHLTIVENTDEFNRHFRSKKP